MSAVDEARRLQAAEPPAEPDPDIHVLRVLRLGRGFERTVSRDFELNDEVEIGSFKDSEGHHLGGKQTMRVVEVTERLHTRPGQPPWIKRLFLLKPASS
jgi:hypothetical protein